MRLSFDRPELEALMKDFYLLTGIRLALFDTEYRLLLAYPDHDCAFCTRLKQDPKLLKRCQNSDRHSFETCRKEQRLILYHCHAGLIEATAPLVENHAVIGYMMFGQISDAASRTEVNCLLQKALGLAGDPDAALSAGIPRRTEEQIHAAAKIMEACTSYAVLKETIHVRRQNFQTNLDSYLSAHLDGPLNAAAVSRELGVSKSKLYEACSTFLGCPIAEYIRRLRFDRAKELLKTTELPVTEIAEQVGFADYNYFCRVFKKEAGISAKKYRQNI